ncbi:Uncharacterised protein [Mycobacteroides abscessus subsp. abscessus]|nr:Uncharacterised protein [Mycobacteroides abscessus subsp. abscessus]
MATNAAPLQQSEHLQIGDVFENDRCRDMWNILA